MRRCLERGGGITKLVRFIEDECGESWADCSNRHGDWGRELVMYLAGKLSSLTLRGIGDSLGGMEYKDVSKAVCRFEDRLANHSNRRSIARALLSQLANGET